MRLIDADKLIKELSEQETNLARHGIMLVKGEYSLYKIINNQQTVEIKDDLIYRKDAIIAMYDAANPLARMWTGDAIRALKSIPKVDPVEEVSE